MFCHTYIQACECGAQDSSIRVRVRVETGQIAVTNYVQFKVLSAQSILCEFAPQCSRGYLALIMNFIGKFQTYLLIAGMGHHIMKASK